MAAIASAETYSFGDIRAQVEIPSDYETVLTPYNLSSKTDWIASQGMDYDALANSFEAEGILLQAIDADTNRTLVISALRDTDAQTYFDLNNQDEDMRKEFRTSHTNGSAYSIWANLLQRQMGQLRESEPALSANQVYPAPERPIGVQRLSAANHPQRLHHHPGHAGAGPYRQGRR
jgi:hypothetical protein